MDNLVYKCQVGSFAYGTNIETSDQDFKGIYIQSPDQILGFNYQPQIEVGKDETYYEIKRFLELAQSGNPTMLEMLFMQENMIQIKYPCLTELFDNRHRFLTTRIFDSFGGYAVSQIKKARGLDKKINWEKEKITRRTPLDFCFVFEKGRTIQIEKYLQKENMKQEFCGLAGLDRMPNCYSLYYDWGAHYGEDANWDSKPIGYRGIAFENSNDIRLSSIPKEQDAICVIYYNKDAYSMHCKKYLEYQVWLQNRNVNRYVETSNDQKLDSKNLMHCVRLLNCATEIAETGNLTVFRPNADYLLSIRRGEVDLQKLLEDSEAKLLYLNKLKEESNLPKEVDQAWLQRLINTIRTDYMYEDLPF